MRHSPNDLVNKRFTRSRSGYATSEVEDYLREVSTDYEQVLANNALLQERLQALEREVERFSAMETMLKEALVVAQIAANETRGLAQREADSILREARARADRMLEEAVNQTESLRQQRQRLGFEFRAMLRAALDGVEAEIERAAQTPAQMPAQATAQMPIPAPPPVPSSSTAVPPQAPPDPEVNETR